MGPCWFLSNKDLIHKVKYQVVIEKRQMLVCSYGLLLQAVSADTEPYAKYNK